MLYDKDIKVPDYFKQRSPLSGVQWWCFDWREQNIIKLGNAIGNAPERMLEGKVVKVVYPSKIRTDKHQKLTVVDETGSVNTINLNQFDSYTIVCRYEE